MLELTTMCQAKYGSCGAVKELPADLRFVSRDQLPLKKQHRHMLSTEGRWEVMRNNYNYTHQSLIKVHKITRRALQNKGSEEISEVNKLINDASEDCNDKGIFFVLTC
jgi:hypothetical protein